MPVKNAFGIDFGTTNSRIAGSDKAGGIRCLSDTADKHSRVLFPSAVAIEAGKISAVGWQALDIRGTRPEKVITGFKKYLGVKANGDGRGDQGPSALRIDNKLWAPEELAAGIFEKLRLRGQEVSGSLPEAVVAAVPVYFSEESVRALDRALKSAGFSEVVHLPEPLAVAYAGEKERKQKRIAIVDAGGGSFQAAVVEMNKKTVRLQGHASVPAGGEDMTALIAGRFFDDFEIRCGEDAVRDPVFRRGVLDEVERAKKALSHRGSYDVKIKGSAVRGDFSKALSRYEVTAIIENLIEKMLTASKESLKQSGVQSDKLDELILCGGTSRMQVLQKRIEGVFGRKSVETGINPDEYVALGAARFARTL